MSNKKSRIYWDIKKIEIWIELNKHKFKNNRVPILCKNQTYLNAKSKLKFICSNCKNEFFSNIDDITHFTSCPICSIPPKKLVIGYNDLATTNPEYLKYLENEEDGYKYFKSSTKYINFKCLNCGFIKNMKINSFDNNGFCCPKCSDGISIPNKFLYNIFDQLSFEFKREKIFENSKYEYDLYVKTDYNNFTIEAHGEQHYKYANKFNNSVKYQQENDINKRKFSESLGNIHIEVDCRESEFNFLKENFIKKLSPYFDLSNINWLKVYENVFDKSLLIEVCNYYDDNLAKISPKDIGKLFNLHRQTVRRYLQIGRELGVCKLYQKNLRYNQKLTNKKINQYDLNNNLLNSFNSLKDASEKTKLSRNYISQCCNNKIESFGGFIWKFLNN